MLPFASPIGLATSRLALRALVPADAAPLFATYTGNAEVARYIPWRRHEAQAQTERMIEAAARLATDRSAYLLAIAEESGDAPAGLVNLAGGEHGVSIGFGLARPSWGQGYGREIVAAVVGWLIDHPSVWRVWGYCDTANAASAAVMLAAGMQEEGTLHRFAVHPNLSPEPRTCRLFAAVR